MAAPFDWKRTRAGEKHIGLGNLPKDDSISTFRNISQAVPGRDMRLPPALRPFHFDQFPSDPKDPARRGPGMVAIQRKLVGSDGKSKGKHSVEAATQVPLLDPMVSIDRTAQQDAWHGNKAYRGEIQGTPRPPGRTLHAPISGTLPVSESQQYLMGDALPEDVHDYDVELDHNGNARVLDEEGQQADLVTYRPFFYDSQGNIVYRDDTAVMEPEDHKQLDIHPLFGRRTKTQTEHMGRPLPHQITGTGDFVMFPAGPVGEMADPIPISQGTRFGGNTGVVTPHGMYFPKGIDWTNVQRAEGLAELGAVLIKAIGDPDEIGWWDKQLGGQGLPQAGGRHIFNWVEANPNKIADFNQEHNVNYPLEGIDQFFPDLKTFATGGKRKLKPLAAEILTGTPQGTPFGENSKMPGAHQNFPTQLCMTGSGLRVCDGSTCENCYAHDHGRAPLNQKQMANWRNSIALRTPEELDDMVRYGSAMANRIPATVLDYGTDLFRFMEGGDFQGHRVSDRAKHLSLLSDVMRTIQAKSPLKSRAWLPTREAEAVNWFLDRSGRDYDTAIPDNMPVTLSAPWVGQGLDNDRNEELGLPKLTPAFLEAIEHPNVTPSFVGAEDAPGMHICPTSMMGGSCMDHSCEACWGKTPISYNPHIAGNKNQEVRLKPGAFASNLQYDKNQNPIFPINLNQQKLL